MDFDHSYLDTVDIEYKHIIKICQHDFIHETVSKEEFDKAESSKIVWRQFLIN
jgi:hypothetical protein